MAQQITARIGQAKTEVVHDIVQHALRSAATASTPNGAIDVLGEALLELERLIALRNARIH